MTTLLRIAAACAALLLAGCSMLGGPKQAPILYAPEITAAPDPAWPSVDWQLSTTRPSATRMLDSSRIVVSPVPGELQVYKNALWARAPTEMLEDAVLRTLEDSGKIAAVTRQGSGIAADYRLLMDVRHFEADYAGAAVPSAVIEVSAKLLHTIDQSVIGTRTIRHAMPAVGADVARVADAFGRALQVASRDIAGWALESGQAHERTHAPTR
jgi:cholesterol transport system auxiliary component